MKFAILARVSTEGQEKDGQSLEVQVKTLRECVERLNGTVVKEYIGQESAMGTKRRDIFTEMLVDCSLNLFDAVMVWDFSRLSRNQNDTALFVDVFKKNNIRLYTQTQEYNLNNPESELQAGMFSLWNNYNVNLQKKKAMLSKITLARRGWAISNPPHGRRPKHDDKSKECEWEVIPEYREQAQKIYRMYVEENISQEKIAEELSIPTIQVRLILFKYSGDEWVQRVRYDGNNEDIIIKIPPLLSPEQIRNAQHRARSNRQFNSRKYQYLLGGKIKCGVCNLTFIGNSGIGKGVNKDYFKQYYTHAKEFRTYICLKTIPLKIIETAVLRAISDLFSSTKNLRIAIENAIGVSRERKDVLAQRIDDQKKRLKNLDTQTTRLVNAYLKGTFTEAEISKQMTKIREDTVECKGLIKTLEDQLQALIVDIPEDLHLRIQKYFSRLCGEEGAISDWSFESQSKILSWFFGSEKDTGVFVLKERGGIAFNVVGALGGSLIGLVEHRAPDRRVFSGVLGVTTLNQTFDTGKMVDFQRILNELDDDDRGGGDYDGGGGDGGGGGGDGGKQKVVTTANVYKNSTPWWASEISPGLGWLPPPTSATAEAVW